MGVYITLTAKQVAYCDTVARLRQESAERNNRRGGNGGPVFGQQALAISIMGVRGEAAALVWLGLKPDDWHRFSETDIGGKADLLDFIDVKTVSSAGRCLLVQPDSPADWAYLLVNAQRHPTYEIRGWLWGHEAKAQRFWTEKVAGRPAYFVPARFLRPLSELMQLVDARRAPAGSLRL